MDCKVLVTILLMLHTPVYGDDNSDCPLPDLLSGVPSANTTDISLCNPDEKPSGTCSILFEEGSVTYNGSSSGSIATYNVTDAYCVNTTMQRECVAGMWINEVILERVATESFLEDWNIALIVIGVIAFVIGDAVAAGLGTMLAVKSVKHNDRVIAITMIVVSVLIVLPVAGPVALITYIVLKKLKHDDRNIQMKWWYRILTVVAIVLKVLGVLLWIVQAGYSATQDFYGEGPLRDENGMCVPHQPNTKEKRVQDALVIISHVLSLVVMVDLHVKAILAKSGTKKSKDSTDSHELSRLPADDATPSSPAPLVTSS